MEHGRPRYRVPDELREALLDFTIAYLLERPTNIAEFGLDFFQRVRGGRMGGGGGGNNQPRTGGPNRQYDDAGRGGGGGGGGQNDIANLPVETLPPDENDTQSERLGSTDVTAPPLKVAQDGRRKSVFAEGYNPEEDDDDEKHTVHPKSDAQRSQLGEAVKHILLFRSLDMEQMNDVIDAMFQKTVQGGDYVIKQGDDGDNFYVIESGRYKVYVEQDSSQKVLATYDGSGSFGELSLMYNMPRAATVQAETDGSLWALDRQTFRRIVLKNAYKKRQMYESLLDSVPMLKTLENYERMNLADALVPKVFQDGEIIIKQGDAADGMYFVEDGEVKVARADGGSEEKEVNRVSKGGYFGELALLTHKPRAATVTAVGTVKCAFLDVDAFERLLGPCMAIMKRNAEDYEQQLLRIFGSHSAITDIR